MGVPPDQRALAGLVVRQEQLLIQVFRRCLTTTKEDLDWKLPGGRQGCACAVWDWHVAVLLDKV